VEHDQMNFGVLANLINIRKLVYIHSEIVQET